jgi:hypothetical protein
MEEVSPWLVPIILTADSRSETIVETLRAGAFDYIIKPFELSTLEASLARAVGHHNAIRERDLLTRLLNQERAQLKVRVSEVTTEVNAYAAQCELDRMRFQSLAQMAHLTEPGITSESLFQSFLEEMGKSFPVKGIALCSRGARQFLVSFRTNQGDIEFVASEDGSSVMPRKRPAKSQEQDQLIKSYVERHTGIDVRAMHVLTFPQVFWGQPLCTVAFLMEPSFQADAAACEFLKTCARAITLEWQDTRLFLYATKQASLGNFAVELTRDFAQRLTAMRIVSDFAVEMVLPAECREALEVIRQNIDGLARQIREFRHLSAIRDDSVETVRLDRLVDDAVSLLMTTIHSRSIQLVKKYGVHSQVVVLNGALLAHTFVDLISRVIRLVEVGSRIVLGIAEAAGDHVLFEIGYETPSSASAEKGVRRGDELSPEAVKSHPHFMLAQRAIRSCGGELIVVLERHSGWKFQIRIPKFSINATTLAGAER